MIRRIVFAVTAISVIFLTTYNLHNHFSPPILSYGLLSVYVFHALASILIYLVIELVSKYLPNQAGYAYLMLIFFKIGAFVLIFQVSVFSKEIISKTDRVGLVVPLFIFLFVEAYLVYKTLNASN